MGAGNLVLAFRTPENVEVTAGTALLFADEGELASNSAVCRALIPESTVCGGLARALKPLFLGRGHDPVRGTVAAPRRARHDDGARRRRTGRNGPGREARSPRASPRCHGEAMGSVVTGATTGQLHALVRRRNRRHSRPCGELRVKSATTLAVRRVGSAFPRDRSALLPEHSTGTLSSRAATVNQSYPPVALYLRRPDVGSSRCRSTWIVPLRSHSRIALPASAGSVDMAIPGSRLVCRRSTLPSSQSPSYTAAHSCGRWPPCTLPPHSDRALRGPSYSSRTRYPWRCRSPCGHGAGSSARSCYLRFCCRFGSTGSRSSGTPNTPTRCVTSWRPGLRWPRLSLLGWAKLITKAVRGFQFPPQPR